MSRLKFEVTQNLMLPYEGNHTVHVLDYNELPSSGSVRSAFLNNHEPVWDGLRNATGHKTSEMLPILNGVLNALLIGATHSAEMSESPAIIDVDTVYKTSGDYPRFDSYYRFGLSLDHSYVIVTASIVRPNDSNTDYLKLDIVFRSDNKETEAYGEWTREVLKLKDTLLVDTRLLCQDLSVKGINAVIDSDNPSPDTNFILALVNKGKEYAIFNERLHAHNCFNKNGNN